MPEGYAILDGDAALDCIGEVAVSPRLEIHVALQLWTKTQRFKFGGDGDLVEASFAVTLPVQMSDTKTWIEAFVVHGSTPHLISQRWLSQHRCLVIFDPNNLCSRILFGSLGHSLLWPIASVTSESVKHLGSQFVN